MFDPRFLTWDQPIRTALALASIINDAMERQAKTDAMRMQQADAMARYHEQLAIRDANAS